MILLLLCLVILVIAILLVCISSLIAAHEYDQWLSEFEANGGVQKALEPVLMGSEVVGYTVVAERRSNRAKAL